MDTNETTILHRLALALTNVGARVFRNQVGEGWYGKARYMGNGPVFGKPIVTIEYPRKLTAGLCVGSSDLVGWQSIEVTPEMVGRRLAVFLAIETKSDDGRLSDDQKNFLKAVRDAGGVSLLVQGENGIEAAALQVKQFPEALRR